MVEMTSVKIYNFTWKLPAGAKGRALRIQLRQMHTLQLLSIQVQAFAFM